MPEFLIAFDAFVQEHRRCGELEAGVEAERTAASSSRTGSTCWGPIGRTRSILAPLGRLEGMADPLPAVNLMQPTLVSQPFHRDGWVYEEKIRRLANCCLKPAQSPPPYRSARY